MYTSLYVRYPLFLQYFSEKFFWGIFEKHANIKFHENSSSGSRVVPCGRADGRASMTKLIVAFRKFANAPKNCEVVIVINWAPHNDDARQSGGKAPRISNYSLGGRVVTTFASRPLCQPPTNRRIGRREASDVIWFGASVNSTTGLKVKALLLGILSIEFCISSSGNHHVADYTEFESRTLGIFPRSEFSYEVAWKSVRYFGKWNGNSTHILVQIMAM
jgi:hypothetical protein